MTGKIIKGIGESGSFLSIGWVEEGMRNAFSFSPFPGTLNIKVTRHVQENLRQAGKERLVAGQEGFCDALLFKAAIGEIPCGVVLPLVQNYPEDLLEIVAPVQLKETLKVTEGDEIRVEIEVEE